MSGEAVEARQDGSPTASRLRRVLLFALGRRTYAFGVTAVAGLAACGPIRTLPAAPRSVVGLAEWRGNVLTVLDLAHLLGERDTDATPCLLLLAPPLEQTAFLLSSRLRLAETSGDPQPLDDEERAGELACFQGRFEHEGEIVRWIDPARLVRRAERRLPECP